MATKLSLEQMKQFVRDHFEDFVNERNAAVIRKNMTPDFYDHDGSGGKPTGVDGDEQMMHSMYKAMPPGNRLFPRVPCASVSASGLGQHVYT
jgi:hypothetical protein